jgi:hypothetical protein
MCKDVACADPPVEGTGSSKACHHDYDHAGTARARAHMRCHHAGCMHDACACPRTSRGGSFMALGMSLTEPHAPLGAAGSPIWPWNSPYPCCCPYACPAAGLFPPNMAGPSTDAAFRKGEGGAPYRALRMSSLLFFGISQRTSAHLQTRPLHVSADFARRNTLLAVDMVYHARQTVIRSPHRRRTAISRHERLCARLFCHARCVNLVC